MRWKSGNMKNVIRTNYRAANSRERPLQGRSSTIRLFSSPMNQPEILDSKTERIVIDLLKKLAAKYETSILIVTHNEDLVKDADRVIRLEDGEIVNG